MTEIAGTLIQRPEGLVTLQRRTDDAPTSPGLLSLFGGHLEPGEEPAVGALRELSEETSLNTEGLMLKSVGSFTEGTQKFFLFTTVISEINFEVYEGVGAETFSIKDVLRRDDLTYSARYTIEKVQGGK